MAMALVLMVVLVVEGHRDGQKVGEADGLVEEGVLVEGDTEDLKDGLDTGVIVGTVVGF